MDETTTIAADPPFEEWEILRTRIAELQTDEARLQTLENAYLHELNARKHAEQWLRIQRNLAVALGSTSDLQEALDLLLQTTIGIESIDSGGVYRVDSSTGLLHLIAARGFSEVFMQEVSQYSPESLPAQFVMRGEPGYWSEPVNVLGTGSLLGREGIRALAVIPVRFQEEVVAVFNLASHSHDVIPLSTRSALENAAAQFGSVVGRIQAEKARRESQTLFRQFAENIREVFWVSTPERLLYVSPAFEEVWGRSRDELDHKGAAFLEYIHPEDRGRILDAYRSELQRGQAFNEEYRIERPDGSVRWIRARSFPVRQDGGELRIVGLAEDITARKAAEESIRDAHAELERKAKSLEEANTAIRVLLDHRHSGRQEFEETVLANITHLVLPYVEKLKRSRSREDQTAWLALIESNLRAVVSPFVRKLSQGFLCLTPMEIRVAQMIQQGLRTKEIGEILHLSPTTIRSHRESLRKKLALTGRKINLRSYLQSME